MGKKMENSQWRNPSYFFKNQRNYTTENYSDKNKNSFAGLHSKVEETEDRSVNWKKE